MIVTSSPVPNPALLPSPLASAGRDGSPARCGSARVRSHCHQQGDPPSLAQRGPHRRAAAGWGPRSPGRSHSSPARNLLGEKLLSSGTWDSGPPHGSAKERGCCSGLGSVGSKVALVACHPTLMHHTHTHSPELGRSRMLCPIVKSQPRTKWSWGSV